MLIDGKTLRGAQDDSLPGVHPLAAFEHKAIAVIGQMRVDAKTNEHNMALAWLGMIDLIDVVVTGGAMFCQRNLSRKVQGKKRIASGQPKVIILSSRN